MNTKKRSTPTAPVPVPEHDGDARVTPEQAARLVAGWTFNWLTDDEEIGDFLLLLRSICFARSLDEREAIMLAIENTLAPYCVSVNEAVNTIVSQRLTAARESAGARS